jgi:hypothetical protein
MRGERLHARITDELAAIELHYARLGLVEPNDA